MPYTSPKTYTALSVHTAADLNTYERDNIAALRSGAIAISSQAALDALYASSPTQFGRLALAAGQAMRKNIANSGIEAFSPVAVLDRDVVEAEVANTVTETSVYSYSVPGGTLSTNRAIHLTLVGDYFNNWGGGVTFTVRAKYGATTILSFGFSGIPQLSTRRMFFLDVWLVAKNATNAQVAYGTAQMHHAGDVTAATAQNLNYESNGYELTHVRSNVAEDSTAAKTVEVTFQHGTSNASIGAKAFAVQASLL